MDIKWFGAMLIVSGCGAVGFVIAAAYRREEKELRQLSGALDYMACELQYRLTPLPDLCGQAAEECQGSVGRILKDLQEELKLQSLPDVECCVRAALSREGDYPQRICRAFQILGTSLGRFDLEGQLKGLEAVRNYCRRELEELSCGRDARLRSYQTLGICTGAALAILLI